MIGVHHLQNKLTGAIFALVALCTVAATPALADVPEWDPRLVRGTLENGLSYIIHDSEKETDPFNIRLIVHAGSVDEDTPSGVAHILEHMVFQSTDAHPETVHRYLQEIGWRTGLQVNAVTRETETQYMIRTRPGDALDLDGSLALMAELAFGARILEDDWEREQLVILEELRQGDSAAARISRQKKEILRTGSRYVDRPTIGTIDGIRQTTTADIRAFYDRFYVASNMTLILSGNIDAASAVLNLQRRFGKAPSKPAPDRSYVKLPLSDGIKIGTVQDSDGSSSQVTYALRLPMPDRRTEDGQFAYLQNYFLTRLIRDEIKSFSDTYQAQAEALTFVSQETTSERLIMAFNARTEKHDEAWPILLEAVERLRRNGLSAAALEQVIGNARRINSGNPSAAEQRTFAEWEDKITSAVLMESVLDAPSDKSHRLEEMLDRITLDSLNTRLREMLSSKDRVLFYQLAGGMIRTAPTAEDVAQEETRLSSLETLPPIQQIDNSAPSQNVLSAPSIPDGVKTLLGGTIISEAQNPQANINEWFLSNGDRVIWLTRNAPDGKVYVSAQSPPGYMNAGFSSTLSQTAVQLWHQSGFNFWSQAEFDRWSDGRKNRWSWALKRGVLDIAVVAQPEELPELLQDYAMSVTFGTVREEALSQFQSQASQSRYEDDFSRVLYGPGTQKLTSDIIQQMDVEDLRDAGEHFVRAPATWFIVGPAPDSDVKEAFVGNIAGIKRVAPPTAKPRQQRHGLNTLEVKAFDAERAKVTMSFFSEMNWTPEGAFITSALTPLAQQALKNRLRLELGGIYSLQFELELDPDSDRMTGLLSFYCDPSRVDELTQAATSVLRDMPSIAEAANGERLKADIDFAEQARLSDTNTWLRRLALSYRRYNDAGYLERMLTLADKITPSLLSAQAKDIFAMNNVAIMKQLPKE